MLVSVHSTVPKCLKLYLSQERERIETAFSNLWDRFIDRVKSRSWAGLRNTILLKILHNNLCQAQILDLGFNPMLRLILEVCAFSKILLLAPSPWLGFSTLDSIA